MIRAEAHVADVIDVLGQRCREQSGGAGEKLRGIRIHIRKQSVRKLACDKEIRHLKGAFPRPDLAGEPAPVMIKLIAELAERARADVLGIPTVRNGGIAPPSIRADELRIALARNISGRVFVERIKLLLGFLHAILDVRLLIVAVAVDVALKAVILRLPHGDDEAEGADGVAALLLQINMQQLQFGDALQIEVARHALEGRIDAEGGVRGALGVKLKAPLVERVVQMIADAEEMILAVQLLTAEADGHTADIGLHAPALRAGIQRVLIGVFQKYGLRGIEGDGRVYAMVNRVDGIDLIGKGDGRCIGGHYGGHADAEFPADALKKKRSPLRRILEHTPAAQRIDGLVGFLCKEEGNRIAKRRFVPAEAAEAPEAVGLNGTPFGAKRIFQGRNAALLVDHGLHIETSIA